MILAEETFGEHRTPRLAVVVLANLAWVVVAPCWATIEPGVALAVLSARASARRSVNGSVKKIGSRCSSATRSISSAGVVPASWLH